MSFDVISLFTRVPVSEALHVIEDLLTDDDTLKTRATMLPSNIMSLARMCLTTTYFQFGSAFYEQVEGAALGSPLSPVGANIYMQDFKHRVLTAAPLKPSLWLRYIDDTFVMWKLGNRELQGFLGHLNGQCAEIQFTMEKKNKRSIPFLEVHVKKDGAN